MNIAAGSHSMLGTLPRSSMTDEGSHDDDGLRVRRNFRWTLAGGILYALNYPSIDQLMGTLPGLKAFVSAVLGGIGNIPGAALGGMVIGVVETFVAGTGWSTYRDAIAFAVLILILLFRPAGLLGKPQVEKV